VAEKQVTLNVVADADAFWIAIDEHDVPNGGSVSLTIGAEHVLVWWMMGKPGSGVTITGTDPAGNTVVTRKSKIPEDKTRGAGVKYFPVKEDAHA
jgi:hypothetical protein